MFYAVISGSGDLTSATEHVTNAFYTSLHVRHTGPEPSDAPNEAHRTSRLHPMANLMSCSLIATYCDLTSPVPHFSGAFYIHIHITGVRCVRCGVSSHPLSICIRHMYITSLTTHCSICLQMDTRDPPEWFTALTLTVTLFR